VVSLNFKDRKSRIFFIVWSVFIFKMDILTYIHNNLRIVIIKKKCNIGLQYKAEKKSTTPYILCTLYAFKNTI
jgi:hypothetical protein